MISGKRLIFLSLYYISVIVGMLIGRPSVFVFMWSMLFELFAMLTMWIVLTFLQTRSWNDVLISRYMTLVPAIILVSLAGHFSVADSDAVYDTNAERFIAFWPQLLVAIILCIITQAIDTADLFNEKVSAEYHLKNYFAVYLQVVILGILVFWIGTVQLPFSPLWALTGVAGIRVVSDSVFRKFFHSM